MQSPVLVPSFSGGSQTRAGLRPAAKRATKPLLVLVVAAALLGCGGGPSVPDRGGPDGRQIAMLIANLNDDISNPKRRTLIFTKDAAPTKPDDVKRYTLYMYELAADPSVSGGSATAKVKMREHRSGDNRGPVEWSFVKEGDAWKIKSAPLP